MNDKIRQIIDQINTLEVEIESEMNKQRAQWLYHIQGKRIEFEHSIQDAHQKLKMGMGRWFLSVRPLNYLTAPIIYGIAVPLIVFDLCIMFYQFTCFPIYGINKVKRADYFSFDHRHLAYLNWIEKFDCLYCSYATGLMAYVTEIVARTEQYFCPIKHAQKTFGRHARSQYFLEYGDAADLHKRLGDIRDALISESENTSST